MISSFPRPEEEELEPAGKVIKAWLSLGLGLINMAFLALMLTAAAQAMTPSTESHPGPHLEGMVILIFQFWIVIVGAFGIDCGAAGKRYAAGRIGLALAWLSWAGSLASWFVIR